MDRKPNAVTTIMSVGGVPYKQTETYELGIWEVQQMAIALRGDGAPDLDFDGRQFFREFGWLLGQPDIKITITRTFD